MSRVITQSPVKTDAIKALARRLKAGGDRNAVLQEIMTICGRCRPSSPLMCVEFCPLWTLKQQYRDAFTALAAQPSLTTLLSLLKTQPHLTILKVLLDAPRDLTRLQQALQTAGEPDHLLQLRYHALQPLLDASLVAEEAGVYRATAKGQSLYNIATQSELAGLPLQPGGHEEALLRALLTGPQTYEELAEIVPRRSLPQSLTRLQEHHLVTTPEDHGGVLYRATKRRPTRKLSPHELTVFKALPREGISPHALSTLLGMRVEQVATYLQQLQYKRHVAREETTPQYRLTEAGTRAAQALKVAQALIHT